MFSCCLMLCKVPEPLFCRGHGCWGMEMTDVSTAAILLPFLLPGGFVAPGGAGVSLPVPRQCWVASPAALRCSLTGAGRCLGKVCGALRALLGASRDKRRDSGFSHPKWLVESQELLQNSLAVKQQSPGEGCGGGSGSGEALMGC